MIEKFILFTDLAIENLIIFMSLQIKRPTLILVHTVVYFQKFKKNMNLLTNFLCIG